MEGKVTIIAGPRDYFKYESLLEAIDRIDWEIIKVVSGSARGVDSLGERWARENGIFVKQFPADWNKYGKKAGYIRNKEMADYADALLALYDHDMKRSPGTTNMIHVAKKEGLLVYVHRILRRHR
jgi:hypothetical protein